MLTTTKTKTECCECTAKKDLTEFDGKWYCEACLDDKTVVCYNCDDRIWRGDSLNYCDDYYCETCFNDLFCTCDNCGESEYEDRITFVGGRYICEHCYNGSYFYCEACGNNYHLDDCGSNNHCRFCEEDNDEEASPNDKKYYKKSRKDIAIGIEIEAENGNYDDVYNELSDKGFGVCHDGSLENGIETQIPKSNNGNTEKLVKRACKCLENNNYEITKRCGLHVHFDYSSRATTIKNLLFTAYVIDDLLFALQPPSRQNNQYCLYLSDYFKLSEILTTDKKKIDRLFYRKREGKQTKNALARTKKQKYANSRYFGFNLHSLYYRKTAEFRHHAGTMNPEKILNWTELLKNILLYVRFGFNKNDLLTLSELTTKSQKLKRLFELIQLEPKIQNYFFDRYKKFNKENCQQRPSKKARIFERQYN